MREAADSRTGVGAEASNAPKIKEELKALGVQM
jgi:hypothetical protein